jgi:hypothetical protein
VKRLSWSEVETEIEESMSPLPRPLSPAELQALRDAAPKTPPPAIPLPLPLTTEELGKISAAAQRKGAPLTNEERCAAIGRKYHDDPYGLDRLKTPNRTLEV